MTDNKLSSSEVPAKFAEWLLAIGCPPDKVPTLDKIGEMCRGHYMVWRSLMEHVEPKDVIRQKRLQVFCDDVRRWKRNNIYKYQKDTEAVIPDELKLWNEHREIKEKVASAEARVGELQKNLKQSMDKISSKLTDSNLSRQRLQDTQRRVWLLQQITEELKTKKENLEETKNIAKSLSLADKDVDLQSKLDKYMSSLRRAPQSSAVATNPAASSTIVSANGDVSDAEEQLSWVTNCRGDALWTQLYERRAGLVAALSNDPVTQKPNNVGMTPERVLAHTAAMHCSLALEAVKNKVHIKQKQKTLAAAVTESGNHLTSEACELLVLQCERARASARVNTLRTLLQEVTSRNGIFSAGAPEPVDDRRNTVKQIACIDKNIVNKKEEVQKLVTSLAVTEKKIQNVRECLEALFSGFQKEPSPVQYDRYRGQLDISQNNISALRQFYEERLEARRNKMQLSMDLDASDGSCSGGLENRTPNFTDELKTYLRQFKLEKNRKLVLESGEKIWIFETLQSSVSRLHANWLAADLSCSLVCPSVSLSRNLQSLVALVQSKKQMETILEAVQSGIVKPKINIDLSLKSEEDETLDKIKKRLNENLLNLQKTNKTLAGGQENLKFWAENVAKKFVSLNRTVDGKSFHDYELIYTENIRLSKS